MASVWSELKRRNVVKVAIAYLIVSWLLVEVAAVLGPALRLPEWSVSFVVFLLILGFPVALVLSWAYELTPDGVKLTKSVPLSESVTKITGRKLDFIIIGLLATAVGFFAYDKFILSPSRETATATASIEQTTKQAIDRSIAVMAFRNMSEDAGNEYFSEGLSEEIINLLVKIPDLRVTSRTSAFSFKGQDVDIPTIAAKLNVAHVLEGSVRQSGDRLRITAQLIEAETDTHLWSDTFNRDLADIFAIQDEIAAAVVNALKIKLLDAVPAVRETDPQAYARFLQARYLNRQTNAEANLQAQALLRQALEIDPEYVPAWFELRSVYASQLDLGIRSLDPIRRDVQEIEDKVLALEPTNLKVQMDRAGHAEDWRTYATHLQRALQLEPQNTEFIGRAANMLYHLGRDDDAIELQEYVATQDPLNPFAHFQLGQFHFSAGRWDEAIASLSTALALSPEHNLARYLMGMALLFKGDKEAALKSMQLEDCLMCLTGLPVIYHALGRPRESDAALEVLIQQAEKEAAYNIACSYAFRGAADLAFEWLYKAIEYEDVGLTGIAHEPLFANIHDDPRWLPLLERVGRSPRQIAELAAEVEFEFTHLD